MSRARLQYLSSTPFNTGLHEGGQGGYSPHSSCRGFGGLYNLRCFAGNTVPLSQLRHEKPVNKPILFWKAGRSLKRRHEGICKTEAEHLERKHRLVAKEWGACARRERLNN